MTQQSRPQIQGLPHAQERAESASDWKEFTAPDGRKYYYNKTTKESKWTLPEELKHAREASMGTTAPRTPVSVTPSVQVRWTKSSC